MKFKDVFEYSFKNITKRKKATILNILLITILFLIIFSSISLKHIVDNGYKTLFEKSYIAKEYMIYTYYDKIDINQLKNRLSQIKGIKKVFDNDEGYGNSMVLLNGDEVKELGLTLLGTDNDVLPKILIGKKFSETNIDTIELVCPLQIQQGGFEKFLATDFIKGNLYLNKQLTIKVDELDKNSFIPEIIKTHEFNAKVVGLYDASALNIDKDHCFTTFKNVKELNNINNFSNMTFLSIIIDDHKNFKNIQSEIISLKNEYGFDFDTSKRYTPDDKSFEMFKSSINLIVLVTITISIFSEILIINKNIKSRETEIGIYKALGYDNRHISKLYCTENIFILLISFVISLLVLSFLLFIIYLLAQNIFYSLLVFTFTLPIIKCILVFLIITILITIICYIIFKLIDSKSSSKLIGN